MEKLSFKIKVSEVQELLEIWDFEANSKLGYDPSILSIHSKIIVSWKCKNGHFWNEEIYKVNKRKNKCPTCSNRVVIKGINDLKTLYPAIAKEWDYDANYPVLPEEISPNSTKTFSWVCSKGHHFEKKVCLRTKNNGKTGCPICNQARSTSFPEQTLYYYVKKIFPDSINRFKGLPNTTLELDIYIPSLHTGIEYDGVYYHGFPEAQEREIRKYKICKENNIKLVRIKEIDKRIKGEAVFCDSADECFFIEKKLKDEDITNFLQSFFAHLTLFTQSHYYVGIDPVTNKKEMIYALPVDIDIKRDRPEISEYLTDINNSFGLMYPELAKNWDPDNNGNLTPKMFSPGSNYKANFRCERCGTSWSASICTVVKWRRTLCKHCSMGDNGLEATKRKIKKQGSLGEILQDAILQWDKEANKSLSPFDIPPKYSKPVFWECPQCGYKWSQSPASRNKDNKLTSCPHCDGRAPITGLDDFETLYPDLAKEWDYTKNKDIKPSAITPNSSIPRYWICSKHGKSFRTSPKKRVEGAGCPLCKGDKIRKAKGFRVEQYNKTLNLIKVFSSINEAADILGVSPESIRQACLNGILSANYYWKYEGKAFGELKPDKKQSVVSINIKTKEKSIFESARAAERETGVNHSHILKCCKKHPKYKTAGGYFWFFNEKYK